MIFVSLLVKHIAKKLIQKSTSSKVVIIEFFYLKNAAHGYRLRKQMERAGRGPTRQASWIRFVTLPLEGPNCRACTLPWCIRRQPIRASQDAAATAPLHRGTVPLLWEYYGFYWKICKRKTSPEPVPGPSRPVSRCEGAWFCLQPMGRILYGFVCFCCSTSSGH